MATSSTSASVCRTVQTGETRWGSNGTIRSQLKLKLCRLHECCTTDNVDWWWWTCAARVVAPCRVLELLRAKQRARRRALVIAICSGFSLHSHCSCQYSPHYDCTYVQVFADSKQSHAMQLSSNDAIGLHSTRDDSRGNTQLDFAVTTLVLRLALSTFQYMYITTSQSASVSEHCTGHELHNRSHSITDSLTFCSTFLYKSTWPTLPPHKDNINPNSSIKHTSWIMLSLIHI